MRLSYIETSATGTAGAFRLTVVNGSSISHFIGVRTPEHGLHRPLRALRPGGDEVVDVTLAAGTYELFCNNNDHDLSGMKIPFSVTP